MAQQGGTYRISPEQKSPAKERSSSSSGPQAQSRCDEKEKGSEEDWEIVKDPRDEQPQGPIRGFHSSFDLQLGWGKWKFSALSWEANAGRQECDHQQRAGQDAIADGEKKDEDGKR
ncbi:hypothetical protein BDP55DRAFT_652033 [Colletotrichum godetiae]|uniref:Uncharacterized protein n=1 Tax=Colletotrichum godetiae TaxID=1209918 RepID=A0AAJ0F1W0_9PEZI|nr:uncharacterized protein BDP55DRAFT_652033 [Colletotrichum godetiae]KAK1689923.1 hypothetical protein BDP55DRAFT_652033 [Colletotrichum godetiae]